MNANLDGRMARCYQSCRVVPSSEDLAFFEFRGEGSKAALTTCKHCRYHHVAHTAEGMAGNVPSNRKTVIEQGKCPGPFEAHGAFDVDHYYCGCWEWD